MPRLPDDRPDDEPPRRQFPLSQPPQKPASWWKSVPGQISILVIAVGFFVIVCQVSGIYNFRG